MTRSTATPTSHPTVLNKTDMCKSLNISTQAFDKWEVTVHSRVGRETFYTVADVVANRIANERKKAVPDPDDDDASTDAELMAERIRLTRAQAEAQELKNERTKRLVVPCDFITFVLSKISVQIASILDSIPLTIKRRFPELEQYQIDAIKGEIIKAMNVAATVDQKLPEWLDDYIDATTKDGD